MKNCRQIILVIDLSITLFHIFVRGIIPRIDLSNKIFHSIKKGAILLFQRRFIFQLGNPRWTIQYPPLLSFLYSTVGSSFSNCPTVDVYYINSITIETNIRYLYVQDISICTVHLYSFLCQSSIQIIANRWCKIIKISCSPDSPSSSLTSKLPFHLNLLLNFTYMFTCTSRFQ